MNDQSLQEIPDLLDQTARNTEEMGQLATHILHQPISYASSVPSVVPHTVIQGDENLLPGSISHPSPDLSELSNTVVQGESHPYDDIQLDVASDLPALLQSESFQHDMATGHARIEQAQLVEQAEPVQDEAPSARQNLFAAPNQAFDSHINRRRGPRQCPHCGASAPDPHLWTCRNHPHNGGTGRGGRVRQARRGGRGRRGRRRGGHTEINSNGHITVRVPPYRGRGRGLSSRGRPHFSFSVRHGRMILSSTDANGNLTQWFC